MRVIHTYVDPRIEAGYRRVGLASTEDKSKRTHISNNFSTSSVVTSLCTKISGGLVLSINDLRKLRLRAGPGKKYSLAATPYQRYQKQKFPISPDPVRIRKRYTRTTSSSSVELFALRVFSVAAPAVSLDELIARFARSPMGTASSGYGSMSDSTRVFGETGVSSEPDDARRGCACF